MLGKEFSYERLRYASAVCRAPVTLRHLVVGSVTIDDEWVLMLGAFVEHVGFRSIRALWARIILKFGKSDAGKLRGKLNRSPNLFSRVNWTFLRKSLKLGNFRSGGWSSNEVALKLSASSSALRRSRTFPCNIFLEFFPVPYHDVLVQRPYGYILAPNYSHEVTESLSW